ncbi:cytochrome P450 [Rhodococcus chondri]|uniref:Cytochrome P450 n=1 Tax=Rhodococcus chondri TaxID=3065941 RepID=A0ABU7JZU8_9NOCA|nr:cytochrome P450 [Rhodococcus sp. CC-R104]MEE2035317.1 cytochrome P450 [Rhodococcus sp. CC-R104]
MTAGMEEAREYPLAPDVPMSLISRLRAPDMLHTGPVKMRDAGGPVVMVRFGPTRFAAPIAVVTSPQGAHDVVAGSDGAFDKEMTVDRELRKWFGDSLFSLPHEPWLDRRRTLAPLFTKKRVETYSRCMADTARDLATVWLRAGTIDLARETRRLTLRVLGRSLLGVDLGDRTEEIGPQLTRELNFVTKRSVRPVRAPAWHPTPARHRMHTAKKFTDELIDEAIRAAREDPGRDAELIRLFFETADPETGEPFTDQVIHQELGAFVVAGHDTTATTPAYCFWVLGHHIDVQDRIAAEVGALGDRPLHVRDVERLPYAGQVLQEALRMCPPGPAIGRMAMREVVVDGYRIPAGTNVLVGNYAVHHDPGLRDDPERFDPDRFAPDRSPVHTRWQYLPFGGGPRRCVGAHFAMLEATSALASVLRAVRIESVESDFPLATPFTLVAAGPVPVRIRPRITAAA